MQSGRGVLFYEIIRLLNAKRRQVVGSGRGRGAKEGAMAGGAADAPADDPSAVWCGPRVFLLENVRHLVDMDGGR